MRRVDVEPVEGYHPEIGLMVSTMDDGTYSWRRELGEVEDELVVWQPFEGAHSIGALILHMIDSEAYWIETAAAGKRRPRGEAKKLLSEETKVGSCRWPAPPRMPLADYYALQDQIRARTLETLKTLTDPDRFVDYPRYGYSLSVRWMVNHVVAHEVYHGGQAVLLKWLWERGRGSV